MEKLVSGLRCFAVCLMVQMVLIGLLSVYAFADESSDIARIIELTKSHEETVRLKSKGEITPAEFKKRITAIKKEKNKIHKSYGKKRSPQRKVWTKKIKAAMRQYKQEKQKTALAAKEEAVATQAAQTPDKEYPQVHLPEEVASPLKTTDIQGIQYEMTKEEVESILKKAGYIMGRLEDEQSYRTIAPAFRHMNLPGKEGPRLIAVTYEQKFKPEIKFNMEPIKEALLKKYGPPTNQSTGPQGLSMSYQPEKPGYDVKAACSAEMEKRGTTPKGMGEIHPMLYKAWQERGERDVIARCPDQLQGFRMWMRFKLGIWASIAVDPRTKIIKIQYEDNGIDARGYRIRDEKLFLKKDSGPEAKPDF